MIMIRKGGLGLVLAVLVSIAPLAAIQEPTRAQGAIHALLINGGNQPSSNYLSHLQHLQDMVDLLQRRGVDPNRIHVFSADGEDSAAD